MCRKPVFLAIECVEKYETWSVGVVSDGESVSVVVLCVSRVGRFTLERVSPFTHLLRIRYTVPYV